MSKYDVHFQPTQPGYNQGQKVFTFGFTAALKVTGFQSLVNRWLKIFFTPRGSDPLDLTSGTSFANMVGGNYSGYAELQSELIMSIEDTNDQIRQQDLRRMGPADEQLQAASIQRLSLSEAGSHVEVWVRIQYLAGTTLVVHLMDLATRQ